MNTRLRGVAIATLLLLAAAAAWWYLANPERKVLRRLDALADQLHKEGDESQLVAAATARGTAEWFAPGFFIRADPYEGQLTDPQQLMGAVMRFRGAAERVDVAFTSREVVIDPVAHTALVGFVATATLDGGSGSGRESWRVRSLWVEDDGEWRIAELELLEQVEAGGLFTGF
jgi:hypothetical protein